MCLAACFSVFGVAEVEDAVTAVGGFDWGGGECSSLVWETCKGFWKSSLMLEHDGVFGIEADGWLRIAIMTESSSSDRSS